MGNTLHTKNDQRTGNDFLNKYIKFSRIIAWIILCIFLVTMDQAKPHKTTFFDRLFNINIASFWNQGLVYKAVLIAILLFVFSLVSLIINSMRLKRKTDHISISLIITLCISIIGIILYFTNYFS